MEEVVDNVAINLTYVIEQGAQGSHLLFDNEEIRHAFANRERLPSLDEAPAESLREAVRSLALLPSRKERRGVIEALPERERDLLILFYFRVIDEYLADRLELHH